MLLLALPEFFYKPREPRFLPLPVAAIRCRQKDMRIGQTYRGISLCSGLCQCMAPLFPEQKVVSLHLIVLDGFVSHEYI